MLTHHLFALFTLTLVVGTSLAYGPIPNHDFCVADFTTPVRMDGWACKDPSNVTIDDFVFSGLHIPGNTSSSPSGSAVTLASVYEIPGVYTQNILLGRVDYAPNGFEPPQIHPKASKIITVLQGTLLAGFVTPFPTAHHLSRTLNVGDVFLVPQGFIHYAFNIGEGNAVALFTLNSQEAHLLPVPNIVFGAQPEIDADYLAASFFLDKNTIQHTRATFLRKY